MDTLSWVNSCRRLYVRKRPFEGECTRYLGSCVTGDFGSIDAYPEIKL